MNKKNILKIIFILSFIPYIILLLISVYHAIFGYDLYSWILPTYQKTIYGIDAFLEVLLLNSIKLCYIPVLPIIFIYQVVYLILNFIKIKK